jgi:glycogen operon protein
VERGVLPERWLMRVWPGHPSPLGATWDGEGTNFAVFSEHATAVELCLFRNPTDGTECERVGLTEKSEHVWHAYLPEVRPGQCYGYRLHGPSARAEGHWFNPAKLLLDPYARAISGPVRWSDELFAYNLADPGPDPSIDDRDSAGALPKCVVVDPAFEWGDDRPPRIPWTRTVIYECHVKGMTMRHPGVPEGERGTYLGLSSDGIVDHLRNLGVTAVELMPVHQFVAERPLVARGLTNYWGYNSIGFFAPDVRYATGGLGQQVSEFKSMVKRFHHAHIEVILDVVYNHTAEGNHLGPTLAHRGIDNRAYYRLHPSNARHYMDFTGCGNTVNVLHPRTLQLVLDSLRYWVEEMHVDGFRFDLAPVLAREPDAFNARARFFELVRQDPVLSRVKLIAEPWDLGPEGYQQGRFPAGWGEWNGRYRDTTRRFWRGEQGQLPDLASRLSGSSDLFDPGRGPFAGINFVTCHDGFTLQDLVSYEHKHNEANGDENRDGADQNFSRNWGVEGATNDPRIQRLRARMKRNFLATLAFSQGVPMLSHGDELGRTQRGNNNAYCQDNELSWVDWENADLDLLRFTRAVLAVRRENPVLRRRHFFRGQSVGPAGVKDVTWLHPEGREMSAADWQDGGKHALGMLVHANATDEQDERGRLAGGDTVLLLLNGGSRSVRFALPSLPEPGSWLAQLSTARPGLHPIMGDAVNLIPHSLILVRHVRRA